MCKQRSLKTEHMSVSFDAQERREKCMMASRLTCIYKNVIANRNYAFIIQSAIWERASFQHPKREFKLFEKWNWLEMNFLLFSLIRFNCAIEWLCLWKDPRVSGHIYSRSMKCDLLLRRLQERMQIIQKRIRNSSQFENVGSNCLFLLRYRCRLQYKNVAHTTQQQHSTI